MTRHIPLIILIGYAFALYAGIGGTSEAIGYYWSQIPEHTGESPCQ